MDSVGELFLILLCVTLIVFALYMCCTCCCVGGDEDFGGDGLGLSKRFVRKARKMSSRIPMPEGGEENGKPYGWKYPTPQKSNNVTIVEERPTPMPRTGIQPPTTTTVVLPIPIPIGNGSIGHHYNCPPPVWDNGQLYYHQRFPPPEPCHNYYNNNNYPVTPPCYEEEPCVDFTNGPRRNHAYDYEGPCCDEIVVPHSSPHYCPQDNAHHF